MLLELKYLDKLYGRILYVLQINKFDQELLKYKKFIEELKRQYQNIWINIVFF